MSNIQCVLAACMPCSPTVQPCMNAKPSGDYLASPKLHLMLVGLTLHDPRKFLRSNPRKFLGSNLDWPWLDIALDGGRRGGWQWGCGPRTPYCCNACQENAPPASWSVQIWVSPDLLWPLKCMAPSFCLWAPPRGGCSTTPSPGPHQVGASAQYVPCAGLLQSKTVSQAR